MRNVQTIGIGKCHDRVLVLRETPIEQSNWELSVGRAISVVQYLISRGVSPQRLAAAGFGEFQPIDTGSNEDAYRRNRRIEFKLTER
jgi:chemotaxis protein MotB